MKLIFDYHSFTFAVDLTASGKSYRATVGDKTIEVELFHLENGKLDLLIDGKRVTAYVSSANAKHWVTVNGRTLVLTKSAAGTRKGRHRDHHAAGTLGVTAPMPGQIRAVNVSEGDAVSKGQTLMVLEAMKMETRIHAPQDGVVKKIFVKQGQTVEKEQILIKVEEN